MTDHIDEYVNEYKIEVIRDGRWWMIRIPDVDGLTQARRLSEVDYMARDYLALATHTPIERIAVHIASIELPECGDISRTAQGLVADRKEAAESLARAQEVIGQYARDLVALKVPLRDVAELLDLSFQRVSQLVAPQRAQPSGIPSGEAFGTFTVKQAPPSPAVSWRVEQPSENRYVLRNTGSAVAEHVAVDPSRAGPVTRYLPSDAVIRPGEGHDMLIMGTWGHAVPNQIYVRWAGQPEWQAIPLTS